MHQFRESISAICIAAAWSDGDVGDFEKQALDRIHVQLGFNRTQIMERIAQAMKHGPSRASVDIPNDEEAQLEFMRLALAVCLADGDVNQHEVIFLSKLANFLSVSPQKLEGLRRETESLLNPQNVRQETTAPERINALLPDQIISLDDGENIEVTTNRETYDPKACVRKPLSELLFEGDDYGDELSLL
jgi:tellurite resistance protein